eukprot:10295078-Alexandrium_andersonii.AAC.1
MRATGTGADIARAENIQVVDSCPVIHVPECPQCRVVIAYAHLGVVASRSLGTAQDAARQVKAGKE